MDITQAFVKLHPLIDNTRGVIATVGELSDYAATYAKEKTSYMRDSDAPGIELVCFKSLSDSSVVDVPQRTQIIALKLSRFLLTRFETGTMGEDTETIRKALLQEFQGDLSTVNVGDLVDYQTKKFPSRVIFSINDKERKNEVTLWYQDAAFRQQYTDYEFDIIPPIENLDAFFADPIDVKDAMDRESMSARLHRVNDRRGNYPYTMLEVKPYLYFDPKDTKYSLNTEWIIVIWGASGNNPDTITRAIKDYILKNSSHTEDEWMKVLPDIFRSNEMIFVPLWNKYALPNKELQAGIFSPVIYFHTDLETVLQGMSDKKYSREWLNANLEFLHLNYRSMSIGVVGHPDSRDEVFRFTAKFGDYISVTNTSPDFNRMSTATKELTRHLNNMVKLAETMTDKTDSGIDYPRIIRNGIVYVSRVIDNKTYLVTCRVSIPNSGS